MLGVLLLAVTTAALLVGWLQLSHLLFALAAGAGAMLVLMGFVFWNGFHQTSPESLGARGIRPESVMDANLMDPGLRRDIVTLIPAFGRRGVSNKPIIRRPAAQPASRSFARPAPVARRGQTERRRGRLAPDALVAFAEERAASGIDDVLQAFDRDLVGLAPVKQRMEEIALLLLVDRARRRFGLEAPRPNLHMCFTGPPGTGKTTVALRMAELLHRLGYLEGGQLVHVMRDDLVAEYIGQTAPKTKRVLDRAMGGVLFIDEAYYLHRAADSKDYGQEVIDILLQVMENQRDQLVVIVAGYKNRMDEFFESNPGMHSRIAHHLDFAAYDADELVAIGRLMLEQASYYMSPGAEEAFRQYLARRMRQPRFGNARSVRNELESARLQHAHRLATDAHHGWSRDDLMRIEPSDILPSWDSLTGDPP